MRRTAVVGLGLGLLAGCGGGGSNNQVVNGTVTLTSADDWTYYDSDLGPLIGDSRRLAKGSTCISTGGFSDVDSGATVTVLNEAGTVIATSKLGPGALDADAEVGTITNRYNPRKGENTTPTGANCVFPFTVEVPEAKFYRFKVSHRDGPNYAHADLEKSDWRPQLSLG